MKGEWISAARAHQIVATALSSGAHLAICSRAFDGLIKARAKRVIVGNHTVDDCPVPQVFWWACGQAALTQNWATGDFSTWIEQTHWRAYGVEFSREDVEGMIPPKEPRKLSLDRSQPGNYAPAARCRDELQDTLKCNPEHVEDLILRACRAGLVNTRCKKISWRVTDRYGATEFEDSNVSIPEWFWEECVGGPDTVLNWVSGRFAGKGHIDSEEYKALITGVQFEVGDIVELEDMEVRKRRSRDSAPEAKRDEQPLSTTPAGRRLSETWRPWVAELVAHIHNVGIPDGVGSQGQEEIIQAVADALARRGHETLSRSTVQPVVQAVLDRMRSAEN